MRKMQWTDDQLIEAVKTSKTHKEVMIKLGYAVSITGHHYGSYRRVRYKIEALELDTSHFDSSRRGQSPPNKKKLSEILVENSTYTGTSHLKKRLLKEGLLEEKCYECGIGNIWNEKPLVLQLDHINGIRSDCRIENLRILCPNCHSQSPTYTGRNIRKRSGRLRTPV